MSKTVCIHDLTGKACVEATGITPLHLATSANNVDVMRLLIQVRRL